jgi:small subunit ribosomal protein S3
MGHKSHPVGLRLGYSMNWSSRWFDKKNYGRYLLEDYKIRHYLRKKLRRAALSSVEIERLGPETHITITTARPGVVIGRGGAGIETLRQALSQMVSGALKLNIKELRAPEIDAAAVAAGIVEQIERRIPFRRAVKGAIDAALRSRVLGIKVIISGRLNGAEISRSEQFRRGTVPLHTFRAVIDYAMDTAFTTYGTVGVKVWIYKQEEEEKKNNNHVDTKES